MHLAAHGPPVAPAVSVFSDGSQAVRRPSCQYPNSCPDAPDVGSAGRQYPQPERLWGLSSRQKCEPASTVAWDLIALWYPSLPRSLLCWHNMISMDRAAKLAVLPEGVAKVSIRLLHVQYLIVDSENGQWQRQRTVTVWPDWPWEVKFIMI